MYLGGSKDDRRPDRRPVKDDIYRRICISMDLSTKHLQIIDISGPITGMVYKLCILRPVVPTTLKGCVFENCIIAGDISLKNCFVVGGIISGGKITVLHSITINKIRFLKMKKAGRYTVHYSHFADSEAEEHYEYEYQHGITTPSWLGASKLKAHFNVGKEVYRVPVDDYFYRSDGEEAEAKCKKNREKYEGYRLILTPDGYTPKKV